jgi:hypothetical protein
MEPKPIQDVALPPATIPPAEPPPQPEIIGDIPVQASSEPTNNEQRLPAAKNDDSSFIVPVAPLPTAANKDKAKPKTKNSQPKPGLAIAIALLAIICVAAGAYLKFFSSR